MNNTTCPFLLSRDANQHKRAPMAYPSFENNCPDVTAPDTLLLTDQATFCLSGSYAQCLHYIALTTEGMTQEMPPSVTPTGPLSNDIPLVAQPNHFTDHLRQSSLQSEVPVTDGLLDERAAFDDPHRLPDPPLRETTWQPLVMRWYPWAMAGLLFFAVLAVGSVLAAYAGWQLAVDRLAIARGNDLQTLAVGPVQPVYLVMTATSEQVAEVPTSLPPNVTQPVASTVEVAPRAGLDIAKEGDSQASPQNGFPQAVTATPIIVVPLPATTSGEGNDADTAETNDEQPVQLIIPETNTPVNLQLPAIENTPTAVPIINVQLAVPTNRPTPIFDIPTSTPEAPTAIPTDTPIPIVGTPVIIFGADERSVPPGECTKVRWHVENVRAVYYESQAAMGDGDKEECLKNEADTFALTVILADGQTNIYTTTVDILWPTPTPSWTPSFTPEVLPTETWTPLPPTATPTPDVVYGATLAINGDNPRRCAAGAPCDVGLLATNTGDSLDTLAIELVAIGNWPVLICSQVGTCSNSRLVIANVGPANTIFANFQVTLPTDSVGQSTTYTLRAVSDGSNGSVTSQNIELTIESNE